MKQKNNAVLVLIPARYHSTRFEGKPLALIDGVPMIKRVFDQAKKLELHLKGTDLDIAVVTDHLEILNLFSKEDVCFVDDQVSTGSERCFLAYDRYFKKKNYQAILNLQGDEPLVDPEELAKLVNFHLENDHHLSTLVKEVFALAKDFKNPNKVKVVYSEKTGQCHYFSRSMVPFDKNSAPKKWFLHHGVYVFSPELFTKFSGFERGEFEQAEGLEQLRVLENQYNIFAVKTKMESLAVDTPEDLEKVNEVIRGKDS